LIWFGESVTSNQPVATSYCGFRANFSQIISDWQRPLIQEFGSG